MKDKPSAMYEEIRSLKQENYVFIDKVSHDFRSHLQAIKGYAEYLKNGYAGPVNEETKEVLGIIEDSSLQFEKLLNDLMGLMRLETGKTVLTMEYCKIEEIVERLKGLFTEPAKRQNIGLEFGIETGLNMLFCDKESIFKILNNLLANSFKFTQENGKINISLKRKGEFAEFSVKDTGCGIPRQEIPVVFEKFHQIQGQHMQKNYSKGSGIGLALCKLLVKMHKGKIWIDETEEKGTDFHFTIPIEAK